MIGIKTLTIGYTKDIELAEKIARATGVEELFIETRPEGDTLMLDKKEQAEWRKRGWTLQGRSAMKKLRASSVEEEIEIRTKKHKKRKMEGKYPSKDYSEGGRLTASMLVKGGAWKR